MVVFPCSSTHQPSGVPPYTSHILVYKLCIVQTCHTFTCIFRLFKQQATGPVQFVGNLVCTGPDTFAVEKAQPSVLFFQRFNSSLVDASVQALEELVMPHMSSDGACSPASLAEMCRAIKPDASDLDKDCFKVLRSTHAAAASLNLIKRLCTAHHGSVCWSINAQVYRSEQPKTQNRARGPEDTTV